jgi:hypothetical protein
MYSLQIKGDSHTQKKSVTMLFVVKKARLLYFTTCIKTTKIVQNVYAENYPCYFNQMQSLVEV